MRTLGFSAWHTKAAKMIAPAARGETNGFILFSWKQAIEPIIYAQDFRARVVLALGRGRRTRAHARELIRLYPLVA